MEMRTEANNGIMRLTLFDINKELCDEWEKEFEGYSDVQVMNIALEELPSHQYLVTAGNSFGIMNGGIDLAVRNMFGVEIQDSVQWAGVEYFNGCIPVGATVTVETGNDKFPFLIYAPTMVVPMPIQPSNVYLAMTSILINHRNVDNIACCGLGTFAGQISPSVGARTMREAYCSVYREGVNGDQPV